DAPGRRRRAPPDRAVQRLPRRAQHLTAGRSGVGSAGAPRLHLPQVPPGGGREVPVRLALALRAELDEGAHRPRGAAVLPGADPVHDRRAGAAGAAAPVARGREPMKGPSVVRFSVAERLAHLSVMVLFVALVLTGFPQKFPHAPWAQGLVDAMGGLTW